MAYLFAPLCSEEGGGAAGFRASLSFVRDKETRQREGRSDEMYIIFFVFFVEVVVLQCVRRRGQEVCTFVYYGCTRMETINKVVMSFTGHDKR